MKKPDTFAVLFNAAGILIGIIAVGYVVQSSFRDDEAQVCSVRYPAATVFALETATGSLLTPIELQARAGVSERGVLENAKVVRVSEAPAPAVLEVTLPKGSSGASGQPAPQGGIGFGWTPPGLNTPTAACLSYSVWLPEDFEFGSAGYLPGLYGGTALAPAEKADGKSAFAARVMWREAGDGEVYAQIPGAGTGGQRIGASGFRFRRGRWAGVEQEVVLNTPGAADGILRVWIDGQLKIENTAVVWRNDDKLNISGVVADTAYGRGAPKDTLVRLSPFELRWQ